MLQESNQKKERNLKSLSQNLIINSKNFKEKSIPERE